MAFLKNRLRKLLLSDPELAKELMVVYQEQRIKAFQEISVLGAGSKYYEEARVFNYQNDKNKIVIGKSTHCRAELLLFRSGGQITIGDFCYLGEGTRLWSADKVTVGSNVLISHNCNIIDTDSHEIDHNERAESYRLLLQRGHAPEIGNVKTAPIEIADYVWLSYNVSILKGVKIGEGAIIAAGSVVTKDVPDFVVMAGNPAVQIKKLKEG